MNVDITQLNMRDLTPCWNSIIEYVATQDILMEHFIHKDSTTWSQTQKSQYIESIMIRAPLNPIVLHGNTFNHTIIDGLNRISAVIELVQAKEKAEKEAIAITVAAEADKKAATDRAEATQIAATAHVESIRIAAKANADKEAIAITTVATAEKNAAQARADARLLESKAQSESEILLADAAERKYAVDAVGKRELNEADNLLSAEQIAMKVKLELIKALPEIIAQSVKPMENIEGIKILQVNGLAGQSGNTLEGESQSTNLADQMTNSALRYRAQAPLVDSLMNELGIKGGDINGFTNPLKDK